MMTEAEWETCQDPEKMLEYLRGRASDRKLRLFAVACCRRIWRLLRSKALREAVEVSEQWADGLVPAGQLAKVAQAIEHVWPGNGDFTLESYPQIAALFCAAKGKRELRSVAFYAAMGSGGAEKRKQTRLLHDIFGNPWHPTIFAPAVLAWQGSTVVRMASAIYEDRRWEGMPLLGDALEEAGVTDQAVLDHCRGPGPHARGCHVVDAILGRS
jgi:hypothetical protein